MVTPPDTTSTPCFLAALRRLDQALAEIRRAQELDPLSLVINTAVARILHFSRRFRRSD